MDWLGGVLTNGCFLAAVSGWFVAQALKIPFTAIVTKELDWRRFFAAGGMPSSHTSMVVALTIVVAFREGTNSALFAACCAFGSIVMYDAAGVRRETGRQGKVINDILASFIMEGRPISDEEMKEIVGHTPFEVFIGAIVGILCAIFWVFVLGIS
ncbi:MAG: divergent PAP2 family protein [Clostridia bacterium]|nr:divergent PAP2 family protein [Clostridia bacterium]